MKEESLIKWLIKITRGIIDKMAYQDNEGNH